MKTVSGICLALGGLILILTAADYLGETYNWWKTGIFAPRYEAVRNKTFKESQAYNDGMATDLGNARLQYYRGTPQEKDAIASTMYHRFSSYDTTRLPADLQGFWQEIKNHEGVN